MVLDQIFWNKQYFIHILFETRIWILSFLSNKITRWLKYVSFFENKIIKNFLNKKYEFRIKKRKCTKLYKKISKSKSSIFKTIVKLFFWFDSFCKMLKFRKIVNIKSFEDSISKKLQIDHQIVSNFEYLNDSIINISLLFLFLNSLNQQKSIHLSALSFNWNSKTHSLIILIMFCTRISTYLFQQKKLIDISTSNPIWISTNQHDSQNMNWKNVKFDWKNNKFQTKNKFAHICWKIVERNSWFEWCWVLWIIQQKNDRFQSDFESLMLKKRSKNYLYYFTKGFIFIEQW